VRELLLALGISYFEADDFEADDIIGTLAKKGRAAGFEVVIVTGDKDALQLVTEGVHVLLTRRGITDLELLDSEGVKARLGVAPRQVAEYKALTGDASDNIPGVPGIGPKTAATLLQQFDSLEGIYEHLPTIRERWQNLLTEHREQVLLSRDLATICCEVPVDCSWDKCRLRPPQLAKVEPLFRQLEFNSLLQRLFPHATLTEASVPSALLPYSRLETEKTLTSWLQKAQADTMSFIIAVNGKEKCPQGIALATDKSRAYVPWNLVHRLKLWLTNSSATKVTYDIKAALNVFSGSGLVVPKSVDDVLLASYLLNPTFDGRSLSRLTREYLGVDLPQLAEGCDQSRDTEEAVWCAQATAVLDLLPVLDEQLIADGLKDLYREVELPLAGILAEMEQTGICVDQKILHQMGEKIGARMCEVERDIFSLVGEEFNLKSPKQLGMILFDKLGLPAKKKTKTGYSTDASVLEDLAAVHPAIPLILEHRQLAKLKSTYVDAMQAQINPDTGRIHTTGSPPANLAAKIQLAPSKPPIIAALSITGATAGCKWRAPKQKTAESPAACLHSLAAVAQPLGLAKQPKITVSNNPN
jgi:DNA polymerase-1